ncbi:hypothetical protein ABPG75_004653 [Micractinium tetrahymenae]
MWARAMRALQQPEVATAMQLCPQAARRSGRVRGPPFRGFATAAAAGQHDTRTMRYAGLVGGPAGPRSQQPAAAQHPQHLQHAQHAHERQHLHSQQPPLAPVEPSVLDSRRWLLQQVPVLQFRAVGVSFEGRQALIPQLSRDQAVAFVREPANPHDPHAVAIRTLAGASLGYIPRDKTFHFIQDLCYGSVGSVGQAESEEGLWGFNVLVQPSIPPAEVLAFPASLRPHVTLGLHLEGPAWAALKQRMLAAAGGRCAVTAVPLAAVHERWTFDEPSRVLRLAGFRTEAPEVQQVSGLLGLESGAAEGAASLLRDLNCWSDADVAAYLAAMRQLEAQRSVEPWRLDLRWLEPAGVPVPPALQALCI